MNGYSQEEIAEKINISRQAYAKWESGATRPDIEKCMRIAEIYGVSLDSLVKTENLEGVGNIPPAPVGKNIWGSVTINERGQVCRERYRQLLIDDYIVIFRINEADKTVYVVTIQYQGRNI